MNDNDTMNIISTSSNILFSTAPKKNRRLHLMALPLGQARDPQGLHPRGQGVHGELRAPGRSLEEALGRALHSQPAAGAPPAGCIFRRLFRPGTNWPQKMMGKPSVYEKNVDLSGERPRGWYDLA